MRARPGIRSLVPLALLLPLLAGCAAQQGVIMGRVALAPSPRERGPLPPGVVRDPRAAVVYVEALPDTLIARLRLATGPEAVTVDITADGFRPRVAAVPVGGTVVYRDRDKVFHHPFAKAAVDSFDTGPIRPGETRTVRVTRSGRVRVFCMLHPEEFGLLAVTPTRVMAQPGPDGEFKLPALPFGHYTLHAWHPAYGDIRREVELRDRRGARVELWF